MPPPPFPRKLCGGNTPALARRQADFRLASAAMTAPAPHPTTTKRATRMPARRPRRLEAALLQRGAASVADQVPRPGRRGPRNATATATALQTLGARPTGTAARATAATGQRAGPCPKRRPRAAQATNA
eukprot:46104-Chlamydomonas_euryale.AAC.1